MLFFFSTLMFTACNSQAPEETTTPTTPKAEPVEEVKGLSEKATQTERCYPRCRD